jgi:hypothetical protein
MDQQQILADIEHVMTEIDLVLWTWQTDLDMMSFIGQEVPMRTYEPPADWVAEQVDLQVKRVPLVRYTDGNRVVIGVAEVNENSGVMKAHVNREHAELLSIPGDNAYSISDEGEPPLDHEDIRIQLRSLALNNMYANPFAGPPLKMKHNGSWLDVADLENHSFFKE